MRACPAGSPVKAHAPVRSRFRTSGFGRRPEWTYGRRRAQPTRRLRRMGTYYDIWILPSELRCSGLRLVTRSAVALVATAAVLAGTLYVGSPYWAIHQLEQAAHADNPPAVAAYFDAPAVRESVKVNFQAKFGSEFEDKAKNPFGALGTVLQASMLDKVVGDMLTPEHLREIVAYGAPRPADNASRQTFAPTEGLYVDINENRLDIKRVDGSGGMRLKLERRGLLSWKVVGLDFDNTPATSISDTRSTTQSAEVARTTEKPVAQPEPEPATSPVDPATLGRDDVELGEYAAETLSGPFKLPTFTGSQAPYRAFRTRLLEAAQAGVNFAGRYALVSVGCGTECTFTYVIDGTTGNITEFPIGGEDYQQVDLKFDPTSSLVKAYWNPDFSERPTCLHADFVISNNEIRKLEADGKRVFCPPE